MIAANKRSPDHTAMWDKYLNAIKDIEGWFYPEDVLMFEIINDVQGQTRMTGDLLEIGVYHGKSAVLLGYFPRRGEQLVVCDLFDIPGTTAQNRAEKDLWYPTFNQKIFERHYLHVHARLPVILRCASDEIRSRGRLSRTFRFVHIDGSHLYRVVRRDLQTSSCLLKRGGIVVIDDYRSIHTPGVAAAVWEAVSRGRLIPFCLTPQKMYATWVTRNVTLLKKLQSWAGKQQELDVQVDEVCGRRILRFKMKS